MNGGFIITDNTAGQEDGFPTQSVWRISGKTNHRGEEGKITTIYFNDQASGHKGEQSYRLTTDRHSINVPYPYMDVIRVFNHAANKGLIVDLHKVCQNLAAQRARGEGQKTHSFPHFS